MGVLVFIRHGQSEWNAKNLFTGWRDPPLTETGIEEAKAAGACLKVAGLRFDLAYTSSLIRAQKTCALVLEKLGQSNLKTIASEKLNERNYGELSGLNKDEARKKWGAEQVHIWRRSFDIPPPAGESLKQTAQRVIPYFETTIRPKLDAGQTILIAAHGNSLRALTMVLDKLSPEEIIAVNIDTGQPYIYAFDNRGKVIDKKIMNQMEENGASGT